MFNFYIPKIEQNVQLLSEKNWTDKSGFYDPKNEKTVQFLSPKVELIWESKIIISTPCIAAMMQFDQNPDYTKNDQKHYFFDEKKINITKNDNKIGRFYPLF